MAFSSHAFGTPNYALLMGVDDYTTYDPTGASNLRGAVADAHAWREVCLHHLKMKESRVKLLINPTREEVLEGLSWLSTKVQRSGSALVTWSGHGAGLASSTKTEEGLSLGLCPSDLTRDNPERIVRPSDVQHALTRHGLARTTFFLDACYVTSADTTPVTRGLLTFVLAEIGDWTHSVGRLFLASHLGTQAYEVETQMGWRGAFSFAAQTLILRWQTAIDPVSKVRYLRVSHDQLCYRIRGFLALLGIPQVPVFVSSQVRTLLVPVLRPGEEIDPAQTSDTPDMILEGEEMSPGQNGLVLMQLQVKVNANDEGWLNLGYVALVGANPPSTSPYANDYSSGSAYWSFATGLVKEHLGGFALWQMVSKFADDWPATGNIAALDAARNLAQQCTASGQGSPNWSTSNYPPIATSPQGLNRYDTALHQGTDSTGIGFALQLRWVNAPSNANNLGVIDRVYYYYAVPNAPAPNLIQMYPPANTTLALTSTTTVPNGYSWSEDVV